MAVSQNDCLHGQTVGLGVDANGRGSMWKCTDCGALGLAPFTGAFKATPTDVPAQLAEFIHHLKVKGVRAYKGEFVSTDGVRVPIELTFERDRDQRGKDGDG
jgi:hypothetical protein